MTPLPRHRADERLVAAYRAGDDRAFDELAARHRATVVRYAASILGDRRPLAEDVAQETLLRAALALRRDDRDINVRGWLLVIARNCCLDELARTRTSSLDVTELGDRLALAPTDGTAPHHALAVKQDLQDMLGDIATLPALQRHALVRREVDGLSHAELAEELGCSAQATRSLVTRARAALVRHREARDTACLEIRRDLLAAADGRGRPSPRTYRHLTGCPDCRRFRSGLRATKGALAALAPGSLVLAGLAAKLTAAGGKATVAKVAAVGCAGVCLTAGAAELAPRTFGAGTPSPQAVHSVLIAGRPIARGRPVPRGVALVQQPLRHAGTVVLRCPAGLRVGDLLAPVGQRVDMYYKPRPHIGVDSTATVAVDHAGAAAAARILCVRPAP